jgi:hypothetical protein
MTQSMTYATLEIKVQAKLWQERPLYLKEGIGEGELQDGRKFQVDATIPSHTLLIRLDDKDYEVSIKDIVAGIVGASS